jgi:hypothetical protein
MRNSLLARIAESAARSGSLASVMTRLARGALLAVIALIACGGTGAATKQNDKISAPPGVVRFNGGVSVPAGSHATSDVPSVAALPPGRAIRRGSADPKERDPPRSGVVLPPRNTAVRVVLVTYD